MSQEPRSTPKTPVKRATRNSLSCAQCRYKHLRCDGQKPACSRCVTDIKQCVYPTSRRRGNPKPKQDLLLPTANVSENSIDLSLELYASTASSTSSITASGDAEGLISSDSQFLSLYYTFFHAAHPCMLPLAAFKIRLSDPRVHAVLQVACYVGSLFDRAGQFSETWSQRAQNAIFEIRSKATPDPFDVQAILLYSIAIYWCNEPEHGVELLNEAIQKAVAIGMNKNEFVHTHGECNPVVEESWRRTWWVIYITDAHIAGISSNTPWQLDHVTNHYRLYTRIPISDEWDRNDHRTSL